MVHHYLEDDDRRAQVDCKVISHPNEPMEPETKVEDKEVKVKTESEDKCCPLPDVAPTPPTPAPSKVKYWGPPPIPSPYARVPMMPPQRPVVDPPIAELGMVMVGAFVLGAMSAGAIAYFSRRVVADA